MPIVSNTSQSSMFSNVCAGTVVVSATTAAPAISMQTSVPSTCAYA
ncbi:hypothetical protein PC129_g16568 [Phytophthora cactorum]|uniref:Uncharacterized protein n=1 Tax=Phytophthora cactorum TaxID=29920 RepID=A0A329RNS6_9STRA|nr:hypothetical protein Pcac1_g28327 [Phytophthora cactorum]KAG2808926.1 hypothetical protein PC111_g16286 [Phytophthora cactorum]KAG2844496.1 hypothetical protein PC112_g2204 [Phytophthora cactorum]KAG2847479.1 hypothetical protein PC113_g17760 [Phytophthora cactorum]KAG2888001.1 hypothetical protein PC114_g18582 [Phytophthora cactorum]